MIVCGGTEKCQSVWCSLDDQNVVSITTHCINRNDRYCIGTRLVWYRASWYPTFWFVWTYDLCKSPNQGIPLPFLSWPTKILMLGAFHLSFHSEYWVQFVCHGIAWIYHLWNVSKVIFYPCHHRSAAQQSAISFLQPQRFWAIFDSWPWFSMPSASPRR